jgi:hypothetical protein
MTERDPAQRALDGAKLTLDAFQSGQLDALRKTLRRCKAGAELPALTEDLRRQIREIIKARRSAGPFEGPQR